MSPILQKANFIKYYPFFISMRFEYLLYPEAIAKIQDSSIAERVQVLKDSEEGLPYLGSNVYQDEIVSVVSDLKERGFYNNLPKEFAPKYKQVMNGILQNPEKHLWSVNRPEGVVTEKCELEDLLLFSGDLASMVLTPEELWNHNQFGFDSSTGFISAVGAYIRQKSHDSSFREGYKWTTKRTDGSEIVTEVTGDGNADLRVFQTDVAPYATTDPFGNGILLRPELPADRHIIAAYHSTEGSMLVAVMKYIEQQGIDTNYRSDGAKSLVEWGRSLGQGGGSCAEHFGGFDQSPMLFFSAYDIPIPQLSEENETDKHSTHWLGTIGDSGYGAYITHNGDLVFSHQNRDEMRNPKKSISARFLPEDAEHLVKGLIYQSAKGLGRTSARQLLGILEYRHSPQFKNDQDRYK